MAELTTADTNFAGLLNVLVSKEIQRNLRNELRWMQPGAFLSAKLIKGTASARWAAYGDLPVDNSLVTDRSGSEGTKVSEEDFAIAYQTLTTAQRMRTIRLTDVAMDESPHDLLAIAAEKIARNAAAVADYVVGTAVAASTLNVDWPNDRANRAALTTGDNLTAAVIRRVVTQMKKSNIPPFPDGKYRAMVDPNVVFDLMSDTSVGGWIEASKYAAPDQLLNGEIGQIAGVRFIETNVGLEPDTTGGVGDAFHIYKTVFFGPEYFAFGDLQTVRSYLVMPGGDHDDPAAQAALVSWKGMYGVEVLGDESEAGMQTAGVGPKHLILEHIGSIAY
jgi:N4-gp56 family major capsid protein